MKTTTKKTSSKKTTAATKKAAATTKTAAPKKTAKVAKEQVPASARVSRKDTIIDLISQPEGATLAAIMEATKWQAHSVRGMISILGSKGGLKIASGKNDAGERTYSLNGAPKAKAKAEPKVAKAKTPKKAKAAPAAAAATEAAATA